MENTFKIERNREKKGVSRRCRVQTMYDELFVSLIDVNECVCIIRWGVCM